MRQILTVSEYPGFIIFSERDMETGQEKPKDKRSCVLVGAFLILILSAATFAVYRIVKNGSYQVQLEVGCDPASQVCFMRSCNPSAGDSCAEDSVNSITYYKIIEIEKSKIPVCDPGDDSCSLEGLSCDGVKGCLETLCDDANVPEGETCNDPSAYIAPALQ